MRADVVRAVMSRVQGVDLDALERLLLHDIFTTRAPLVDVVRLRSSFQDAAERGAIRQLADQLGISVYVVDCGCHLLVLRKFLGATGQSGSRVATSMHMHCNLDGRLEQTMYNVTMLRWCGVALHATYRPPQS
jgi:hypothetical protein